MKNQQKDFLQELGYLGFTMRLKRISDQLMQDGRKLYQSLGLNIEPNWYGVLLLLDKHGKLGVMEVADHLQLAHPSAISILNKMEKAGYLLAEKDPEDQRKRHISLTPMAQEKLAIHKKVWSAGTEAVRQLTAHTNLFADLRLFEEHYQQNDFADRTLSVYHQDQSTVNPQELTIVPFSEQYADDFGRINYEWLHMYFKVEPHDYEMLDNPKSYIIDKGGQIFFALCDGFVVGTVALIKQDNNGYELAKMGVSPMYKGKKIGEKLLVHALDYIQQVGEKRVYLESNSSLEAALSLYRKAGFTEVEPDPNTPYQRCDIRMELVF
jgi:DNA-binding MarR family transcriptional regulator/N-acetylglutamate synthase-like GNAT family acetyltransferase